MLRNDRELKNTRAKLRLLEESYEELSKETGDDELRAASMESLKRLINQFKEEIARYEVHQPARR
jgi:flagellar biosynthesis chaperone FliJ